MLGSVSVDKCQTVQLWLIPHSGFLLDFVCVHFGYCFLLLLNQCKVCMHKVLQILGHLLLYIPHSPKFEETEANMAIDSCFV